MNNFFITGLPRSRTAWLANLLTYSTSFCWHDALTFTSTIPRLWTFLCEHIRNGYDYLGNSDSALLFHRDEMVKLFPEAKWVIVERDSKEVAKSFWDQFHATYPGGPTTFEETCLMTSNLSELFQKVKNAFPNCLHVKFTDLENPPTIEAIWKHCLPSLRFNGDRLRMLETFRVNVIARKVAFA